MHEIVILPLGCSMINTKRLLVLWDTDEHSHTANGRGHGFPTSQQIID